jgi:hypothetical protein
MEFRVGGEGNVEVARTPLLGISEIAGIQNTGTKLGTVSEVF